MAKGGITKGKSHKEGGIPMVVKSTGQKVELEGGEGVINKRNMADTKKHKFDGKELTKCEIVSEINEDYGNGVKIDCDDIVGRKYKYKKGGKVSKVQWKEMDLDEFYTFLDNTYRRYVDYYIQRKHWKNEKGDYTNVLDKVIKTHYDLADYIEEDTKKAEEKGVDYSPINMDWIKKGVDKEGEEIYDIEVIFPEADDEYRFIKVKDVVGQDDTYEYLADFFTGWDAVYDGYEEEEEDYAKGGKVSEKIKILKDEGYPHKQAVAIALNMRDNKKLAKGGSVGIKVSIPQLDFLNNELRMTIDDFYDEEDEYFVDMIKTLMKKIDEAYKNYTLNLTNSEKSYLSEQISMVIGEGEYGEDYYLSLKELEDLQNKLNSYAKGGSITWKEKYNKKYGHKKGQSHNLSQISKDTGVSKKGLQEIYDKGIGAYKTNPSSVRPNVKSKEQWAMGRVYSAVMGGKASKIDKKELQMDMGGTTPDYHWFVLDIEDDKLINGFEKEFKEDAKEYIDGEVGDDKEYRKNFKIISKRTKEEMGYEYPPTKKIGGYLAIASQLKGLAPKTFDSADELLAKKLPSMVEKVEQNPTAFHTMSNAFQQGQQNYDRGGDVSKLPKVYIDRVPLSYADNNGNKITEKEIIKRVYQDGEYPEFWFTTFPKWQERWYPLYDAYDSENAYDIVRRRYGGLGYLGIADTKQMLMGNAMRDNFEKGGSPNNPYDKYLEENPYDKFLKEKGGMVGGQKILGYVRVLKDIKGGEAYKDLDFPKKNDIIPYTQIFEDKWAEDRISYSVIAWYKGRGFEYNIRDGYNHIDGEVAFKRDYAKGGKIDVDAIERSVMILDDNGEKELAKQLLKNKDKSTFEKAVKIFEKNPNWTDDGQMVYAEDIVNEYKYAKGGYVSFSERKEFEDYLNEFYGKSGIYKKDYDGGFTKEEIEIAVDKYIQNPQTNWGGGDSVDRELTRDKFLIPSKYPNRKTEFKKGGHLAVAKAVAPKQYEKGEKALTETMKENPTPFHIMANAMKEGKKMKERGIVEYKTPLGSLELYDTNKKEWLVGKSKWKPKEYKKGGSTDRWIKTSGDVNEGSFVNKADKKGMSVKKYAKKVLKDLPQKSDFKDIDDWEQYKDTTKGKKEQKLRKSAQFVKNIQGFKKGGALKVLTTDLGGWGGRENLTDKNKEIAYKVVNAFVDGKIDTLLVKDKFLIYQFNQGYGNELGDTMMEKIWGLSFKHREIEVNDVYINHFGNGRFWEKSPTASDLSETMKELYGEENNTMTIYYPYDNEFKNNIFITTNDTITPQMEMINTLIFNLRQADYENVNIKPQTQQLESFTQPQKFDLMVRIERHTLGLHRDWGFETQNEDRGRSVNAGGLQIIVYRLDDKPLNYLTHDYLNDELEKLKENKIYTIKETLIVKKGFGSNDALIIVGKKNYNL